MLALSLPDSSHCILVYLRGWSLNATLNASIGLSYLFSQKHSSGQLFKFLLNLSKHFFFYLPGILALKTTLSCVRMWQWMFMFLRHDKDTVIRELHDTTMQSITLLAFAFNCNSFCERLGKKGLLLEKGSGADWLKEKWGITEISFPIRASSCMMTSSSLPSRSTDFLFGFDYHTELG